MAVSERLIERLNGLLMLDHDALDAYEQAITRQFFQPVLPAEAGGIPERSPPPHRGPKTALKDTGPAPRTAATSRACCRRACPRSKRWPVTKWLSKAMQTSERLTNRQYQDAVEDHTLPEEAREIVVRNRADKARHLDWINKALSERLWEVSRRCSRSAHPAISSIVARVWLNSSSALKGSTTRSPAWTAFPGRACRLDRSLSAGLVPLCHAAGALRMGLAAGEHRSGRVGAEGCLRGGGSPVDGVVCGGGPHPRARGRAIRRAEGTPVEAPVAIPGTISYGLYMYHCLVWEAWRTLPHVPGAGSVRHRFHAHHRRGHDELPLPGKADPGTRAPEIGRARGSRAYRPIVAFAVIAARRRFTRARRCAARRSPSRQLSKAVAQRRPSGRPAGVGPGKISRR